MAAFVPRPTWDSFVPYQNDKAPKESCQRINGGNRMKAAKRLRLSNQAHKRLADRARAKAPYSHNRFYHESAIRVQRNIGRILTKKERESLYSRTK